MRKHYTEFLDGEHQLLLATIRARRYTFGAHAFDRMREKRVSETQILAMLTYCSVVEIHNNVTNDLRVLVRGKVQGNFVCAVLSLVHNEVVTTYWNRAGDHHATLDRTQYGWNVSVSQALAAFNC